MISDSPITFRVGTTRWPESLVLLGASEALQRWVAVAKPGDVFERPGLLPIKCEAQSAPRFKQRAPSAHRPVYAGPADTHPAPRRDGVMQPASASLCEDFAAMNRNYRSAA